MLKILVFVNYGKNWLNRDRLWGFCIIFRSSEIKQKRTKNRSDVLIGQNLQNPEFLRILVFLRISLPL